MSLLTKRSELTDLRELSARLGRNPLLVQASSGNTSVKLGDVLWVKASGKWLADAMQEEVLVPVNLAEVRQCVRQHVDPAEVYVSQSGNPLRASVETSMHAVLPHPVVIHVHSVNTIAWAVRRDGRAQLKDRLAGLRWQWIPYVASGLPLAKAIKNVLVLAPDVLVLGNHGLVVCGQNCTAAEALLYEVERRLAITPRRAPKPDFTFIAGIPEWSGWCLPESAALHALGTDPVSRETICGGVLYPCQAIFLSTHIPVLPWSVPLPQANKHCNCPSRVGPLLIAKDRGVCISENMTNAEYDVLVGLMHVAQRIDASVPIRYMTKAEVENVLNTDTHGYRTLANQSGR
jgi:ribulose-5-phosphate 4-epimerase/fuculose-1-phosphate aldolase